jgi:phage N-6-adenine-methyltransferase
MALTGFKAQNHPQQVGRRGARPEVDNLETPVEMFAPLHERFGFTVDVAALPHNAKLPRYFTPESDGLEQSWSGERVWCNPPYSDIEEWVKKAWFEFERPDYGEGAPAEMIVMLLPANRTEQGWWPRQVEQRRDRGYTRGLRVEFLSGRPRFIKYGFDKVEPNQRPPFGCCLLIWEQS